ncbi:MAG: hypothetical protein U0521_06860 [Anaerolineae bacterium]
MFVRFPANDAGRALGKHCVNEDGEIQVMLFPESDPILNYLRDTYGIRYYEVRSSNISGSPEEPFAPGAVEYACAIAAPVVAVRSFEALEAQIIDQALFKQNLISVMRRKRFGSFPIVRLPQLNNPPTPPSSRLCAPGTRRRRRSRGWSRAVSPTRCRCTPRRRSATSATAGRRLTTRSRYRRI